MTNLAQLTTSKADREEKSAAKTVAELLLSAAGRVKEPAADVRGAYLHVPFCFHKCHYCDFYSIVDSRDRQGEFARRLAVELGAARPWITRPLETIFIGGGTPTLLASNLWRDILLPAIHEHLSVASNLEFTVEANPETVTSELLEVLVSGGVNRISIGAQSFNIAHLKTLERWHDPANVGRSVRLCREAGIDNVNLDLIFSIPGQTLDEWLSDLDTALDLRPTHLSCYSLMYEPNTPLTAKLKAGQIQRTDEDLEAAMFEATMERLVAAGFVHYEVSNWARPGRECRHNLLYWTNQNWWPLGPGAAGHWNGVRWKNVPRLGEYLEIGPLPPITEIEHLDPSARIGEILMLRLRMLDGMPWDELESLLGPDTAGRMAVIQERISDGLLARENGRLRLTGRGLMIADAVLSDLI